MNETDPLIPDTFAGHEHPAPQRAEGVATRALALCELGEGVLIIPAGFGQPRRRRLAEADFREAITLAQKMNGKPLGTVLDNQPSAIDALYWPPRRGAKDARLNPRLVHRGVRHRRPQGREGLARPAERVVGGRLPLLLVARRLQRQSPHSPPISRRRGGSASVSQRRKGTWAPRLQPRSVAAIRSDSNDTVTRLTAGQARR